MAARNSTDPHEIQALVSDGLSRAHSPIVGAIAVLAGDAGSSTTRAVAASCREIWNAIETADRHVDVAGPPSASQWTAAAVAVQLAMGACARVVHQLQEDDNLGAVDRAGHGERLLHVANLVTSCGAQLAELHRRILTAWRATGAKAA